MNTETVTEIVRQALTTAFWLAAPILAVAFVAGIVISLVQIVTSIQDSGFSTIPRLVILAGALVLLLPWMCMRMMSYTTVLLGNLERYAR
jgi:flagellar biosynthesis protein FliQ